MEEDYTDKSVFEEHEFRAWVTVGINRGWITEPFCYTHDGDPYMTEEEEKEWEDGGDPCSHVVKLIIGR
jgi:hypothetical protein